MGGKSGMVKVRRLGCVWGELLCRRVTLMCCWVVLGGRWRGEVDMVHISRLF